MSGRAPRRADVYGAGPVGLTCARLLANGGWSVRLISTGRPHSRPIALSARTVNMICETWGLSHGSLSFAHPLEARCVSWSGSDAVDMEFAGLSLDAAALCRALERHLIGVEIVEAADSEPTAWVIEANGRPPPGSCQVTAGGRVMSMWQNLPLDRRHSWRTETLAGPGFWIFLLPTSSDRLCVQIATPTQVLDHAQIAERLRQAPPKSLAGFVARNYGALKSNKPFVIGIAPRLGPVVQDAERLPAGGRAMTFDPVSGDGTGQGIRSALLAVAGLNSLADGLSAAAILRHMTARHRFAMAAHLRHCLDYYRTIAQPVHWAGEIASTEAALSCLGTGYGTENDRLYLRYNPMTGPKLVPRLPIRA